MTAPARKQRLARVFSQRGCRRRRSGVGGGAAVSEAAQRCRRRRSGGGGGAAVAMAAQRWRWRRSVGGGGAALAEAALAALAEAAAAVEDEAAVLESLIQEWDCGKVVETEKDGRMSFRCWEGEGWPESGFASLPCFWRFLMDGWLFPAAGGGGVRLSTRAPM
ncbi:hypothetical protein KSP39_PZI021845 [Platanthera zijinensis]|uniref:Uncharacterized protein n=1 Tax=Platanthera zijinensis TaxID=2320716 RepID=A0AAP0AYK9_9ASPA